MQHGDQSNYGRCLGRHQHDGQWAIRENVDIRDPRTQLVHHEPYSQNPSVVMSDEHVGQHGLE